MKKMVKSNKGFTLIELVIVIAILGVLAAVAITMFPKITGSSRTTADKTRASQIKSAISTYVTETGDFECAQLLAVTPDDAADTDDVQIIIANLQKEVTIGGKNFGPYLENVDAGDAKSADYLPQASGMTGWNIDSDANGSTSVKASAAGNTFNDTTND